MIMLDDGNGGRLWVDLKPGKQLLCFIIDPLVWVSAENSVANLNFNIMPHFVDLADVRAKCAVLKLILEDTSAIYQHVLI